MKKNDTIELTIDSVSLTGTGVGRHEGMAVFVDQTAVGDVLIAHIIKVKKNYAVGKLERLIQPSPTRCEVDCGAFRQCGGCAFRHIRYEEELRLKQEAVADAMRRIGGINQNPLPILPSPQITGYRNKAQYPISRGENGLFFGFYARHSHRIVESGHCCLQPPVFDIILAAVKQWADRYDISAYDETVGQGVLRHLLLRLAEQTGEVMVVPVINAERLPREKELTDLLKERLGDRVFSLQYNINRANTNVILGEKTVPVFGPYWITDEICGVRVRISPQSFYQVNRAAAELLYQKAASYIEKTDRVLLDLFCGIGAIGLSVLQAGGRRDDMRLYGVEIVPSAVENAVQNAALGNFENCEFICADAAEAADRLSRRGIRPDVVIVDPPRKGCDERLLQIIADDFSPNKLIYISCDPATLARDCKILGENGYHIEEYSPVDLFPRTAHVETVALFSRQEAAKHITRP